LYAQSSTGLALSPVRAGLSLLPMSAGLLAAAFSAPRLIDRWGPRGALSAAAILTALAAVAIATGSAGSIGALLLIGLFGIGIGLAVPYATAPRLALAALRPERAGAGAGVINACTFLGGSIGVAGGAVAYAAAGLPAVTGLIAVLSLAAFVVCRRMPARA
jgi:predicted MFS family arabinose efflux permease